MIDRLAVFRADADPGIGGGHVVRSLALADGLAAHGWCCVFACSPATPATVPALVESGHRIVTLDQASPGDEAAAIGAVLDAPADWLVVDHYGHDAAFHHAGRAWARRILVIDELADRPLDADLLVDPTPSRSPADYDAYVPAGCEMLFGPGYALLRPGFVVARPAALARREEQVGLDRILVSFGSVDARDRTAIALEGIHRADLAVEVDIVLGAAAPHAARIGEQVGTLPFPAILHEAVEDMPGLMAAADLGIGAGGATSWERCCMGLPAVVMVEADNQSRYARELAAAGAAVNLGDAARVTADDIAAALVDLAAHPQQLVTMSGAAAALCDGDGVARLIDRMTP